MWRNLVVVVTLAIAQLGSKTARAEDPDRGVAVAAEKPTRLLIEYRDSAQRWQTLCITPCSEVVAPDTMLRVHVGTTITEYAVAGRAGDRVVLPIEEAHARATGRAVGRGFAIAGVATGGLAILVAVELFLLSGVDLDFCLGPNPCERESEASKERKRDELRMGAGITLAAGTLLFAASIVPFVLLSRKSTTRQVVMPREPPSSAEPAASWRRPAPAAMRADPSAARLPGAISAPLFTVTF